MDTFFSDKRRLTIGYWLSRILLILFVLLTFFPFVMLLFMSFKPNILILTDFFGLPEKRDFAKYIKGI